MLTIKTSSHVPTNRHRRNFRSCPVCTGAPMARDSGLRLVEDRIGLIDAELRRLWLDIGWRSHLGRVRFAQVRSRQ
jgi:hypothetical protein